jgi:hypothetical protein
MRRMFLIAFSLFYMNGYAQMNAWPVAVSDDGLLVGKHMYDKAGSSYNSIADTVDIKTVQSIKAIYGIHMDTKNREIHSLKAAEFEMAVRNDTTTLHSNSEFLTDDMKALMKKLTPGDVVFFQYIRLVGEDFKAMTTPLFLYLK